MPNGEALPLPVSFLTPDQAARYGRYEGEPTDEQLTQYFYLDDADRQIIRQHRGAHNQLGFALQLTTVRFLGTFLSDPSDVPTNVRFYIAQQIAVSPQTRLDFYVSGRARKDHVAEIRQLYGYRDFQDQPEHFRLVRWLYSRAWLSAERPSVLFDLATARLVEQKILLPGVTTLTRLIAQVRDRASQRLWQQLNHGIDASLQESLESLLQSQPDKRQTRLDQWRRPITKDSAPGLVKAIDRWKEVQTFADQLPPMGHVPSGRLRALARYATAAKAHAISTLSEDRRIATLVAFVRVFAIRAQDDALDLFEQVMTNLLRRSNTRGDQERLRTLQNLDMAARRLRTALTPVLDDTITDEQLRLAIFTQQSRSQILEAIEAVDRLTQPPDDRNYYENIVAQYGLVRRFLPRLLDILPLQATPAGQTALAAWRLLREYPDARRKIPWEEAPCKGMTAAWRRMVYPKDKDPSYAAYTLWVLTRVHEGLRRRDLYVTPSDRWDDPRSQLVSGKDWEALRPQILRTLNLPADPEVALKRMSQLLNEAYQTVAAHWDDNSDVRLDEKDGSLILTPLDELEEPASLIALRESVSTLLPRVELPELLLEIQRWTGFIDAFTHISEGGVRVSDLESSICAVLVAEACNIGLEPLVRPDVPALTYDRLMWVQQHYVRADTITQANNRLVEYHSGLSLTKTWGGGEVASADGLRFVVPVRTVNAGPNPQYFGVGRGVTYYNFTSDQFSGLHGIVIPGTLRDSMYLLELVLEQQTNLRPTQITTDTAGYSDIVFGLFSLLGYQFSPRLADLGEARFWRLDPQADYGPLNSLSRHRIHQDLIVRHWDDLLRVAGSLETGAVNATQLIRALQRNGKPTVLGRAIAEWGRIPKTLHLLRYIDDPQYRRQNLNQLNRGEGRHRLARAVFHGRRGELRQRYREGQEDQLGALGLVVNTIVLWNTQYMEIALNYLRKKGVMVQNADVQRLSPLRNKHINFLGQYNFALPEAVEHGGKRPLRTTGE